MKKTLNKKKIIETWVEFSIKSYRLSEIKMFMFVVRGFLAAVRTSQNPNKFFQDAVFYVLKTKKVRSIRSVSPMGSFFLKKIFLKISPKKCRNCNKSSFCFWIDRSTSRLKNCVYDGLFKSQTLNFKTLKSIIRMALDCVTHGAVGSSTIIVEFHTYRTKLKEIHLMEKRVLRFYGLSAMPIQPKVHGMNPPRYYKPIRGLIKYKRGKLQLESLNKAHNFKMKRPFLFLDFCKAKGHNFKMTHEITAPLIKKYGRNPLIKYRIKKKHKYEIIKTQ